MSESFGRKQRMLGINELTLDQWAKSRELGFGFGFMEVQKKPNFSGPHMKCSDLNNK